MESLPFENTQRERLVKKQCATDSAFGCKPQDRKTEDILSYGVITINKPAGPTSHMVAGYVQRILAIERCGHGGTLDPGVTGVLPVALGRATRVVEALLKAGKEYVCLMHVHADLPPQKIESVMRRFIGRITQLPPVKSAVVRRLRERTVYYMETLDVKGRDVLFRVGCEAGTYIRKLVHDFGKELGCGAHMAQLVRTKAGPFTGNDWVTLQDLEDAIGYWREEGNDKFLRRCIQPVERAVEHLPKIWVQDSAVDTLAHGASLSVPGIAELQSGIAKGDLIAVMTLKDELVSLGTAQISSEDIMAKEKGIAVKTLKVFMPRGVYPKGRAAPHA